MKSSWGWGIGGAGKKRRRKNFPRMVSRFKKRKLVKSAAHKKSNCIEWKKAIKDETNNERPD